MGGSQTPQKPTQDPRFDPRERWALIVGGVILVIGAAAFWFWPVQHTKPAPNGTQCTDPAKCVVSVDDVPETLLTSLLALGVLLLVIGVNGRRITTIKGAGVEFDTAAASEVAATAKTKVKDKAPGTGLTGPQVEIAQHLAAAEARARVYEAQSLRAGRLSADELDSIADLASSDALTIASK
jgi:hypothetical protein